MTNDLKLEQDKTSKVLYIVPYRIYSLYGCIPYMVAANMYSITLVSVPHSTSTVHYFLLSHRVSLLFQLCSLKLHLCTFDLSIFYGKPVVLTFHSPLFLGG